MSMQRSAAAFAITLAIGAAMGLVAGRATFEPQTRAVEVPGPTRQVDVTREVTPSACLDALSNGSGLIAALDAQVGTLGQLTLAAIERDTTRMTTISASIDSNKKRIDAAYAKWDLTRDACRVAAR